MRTLRILLKLAALLVSACFSVNLNLIEARAVTSYDELYPLSCPFGQYEVAALNSSGRFERKKCTSSYSEAAKAMALLGDAGVVRHSSSGSATKIINMNAGVVYSYPQRNGTNIAVIDQYVDGTPNEKTTYVTVHREMRYLGVHSWNGNGDGKVHIVLNGFDGYISLSDVDLVPMAALTGDIPMYLGGNDTTGLNEYPFLTHVQQAYYRAEKNGNYIDLVYHCFTGWGGPTTWPSEWTFALGPAPDWMNVGNVYYSDDGTSFYNDRRLEEQAGIYYPYYQFLPLRTKTGVSAKTLDKYISKVVGSLPSVMKNTGSAFIESGNTYGMNALLVFALGCLESGNGRSDYAMNRNNLFGIAAYDTNPNAAYSFPSVSQCIKEEMGIFLRSFTDINSFTFFGPQLGNKGSGVNVKYAGDPYWGMKIASIAYAIDKLDNNEDGTLTDYNAASLGVIRNDERVDIQRSVNSGVLYNSAYGATYQKNHMVTLLEDLQGHYRIQSTSYLSGGKVRSIKNEGLLPYDWSWSGYLSKEKVEQVNSVSVLAGEIPQGDFVLSLSEMNFSEKGEVSVKGMAYMPGIRCDGENTLTHELCLLDETFKEIKRIRLESTAKEDESTFAGSLSLADVARGAYYLKLISSYKKTPEYSHEAFLSKASEAPSTNVLGNTYMFIDRDDASLISVEERNCGEGSYYDTESNACACMEGFEASSSGDGCVVSAAGSGALVRQRITSFAWKDENVLNVSGEAFLPGIDAGENTRHTVLLVRMEDDFVTEIEAETSESKEPADLLDGHVYSRISYSALIDPSSLAEGTYTLKIRIESEGESGEALMHWNRAEKIEEREINGYLLKPEARALSNYRLEITKEKNDIDFSVIEKPYQRGSVYTEHSLTLEDGILSMDASALIFGANLSEQAKPECRILLVDESGKVREYPCQIKERETGSESVSEEEAEPDAADFTAETDLRELEPGRYRMYLDLKTREARDIFEVCNPEREEALEYETESASYTLEKSPVHNRYEITVRDLTLAH